MVTDSETNMESVTESDADSDCLREKGSVKQGTKRKKKRMMTRSSRSSPRALTQKMIKRPSSESGSKILREDFKKKDQIPVSCGNKDGILYKKEFNNGEPCILSGRQWFTPSGFEKFGGKEKHKKWKTSIFYRGVQLQTLIEENLLSRPSFKHKRTQDKEHDASPVSRSKTSRLNRRTLFKSNRRGGRRKNGHTSEFSSTSESSSEHEYSSIEEEEEEDDDDRVNVSRFQGDTFPVTCFRGKGVLYIKRFAKAECGKCIRTHQAWLTPQQFLEQNRPNGNWRRDIKGRGIPIGDLIVEEVLKPHTLNCKCSICKGDPLHQLDQNNDDVCFSCNSDDGDLLCCDKCPRAFHHQCHYPIPGDDAVSDHWTCSYCLKLRDRH